MTPASDTSGQDSAAENQDSDIATARGFYAELLAFEDGMAGAAAFIRNRGRWLEAIRHLHP